MTRTRPVVLFALAAACSSPPSSERVVGTAEQPIVHGVASGDEQNFVVLIYDAKASFECTGTLISPSLVLTARHCVTSLTSGDALECDGSGNAVSGGQLGDDYAPSDLAVYWGATRSRAFPAAQAHATAIFHDGATNLCNHDFAILQIAPAITAVTPAAIRLDAGPTMQDTATVVGWGVTDTQQITSTRTQRPGVRVLSTGPSLYQGVPVPPNNFMMGESICDGDSGAPAIADFSGAVIGIASSGTNGAAASANNPLSGCVDNGSGVINTFTSIAPFKSVIATAFAATGGDPNVDDKVPPAPSGGGRGCSAAPRSNANGVAIACALAWLSIRVRRRRAS